jgi:hypothetical protein
MRRALLFAVLTLGSACAAQAKGAIVQPPLDVPLVPARVIVPEIEEVELAPPVDPASATRPTPARGDSASKPADKPDPPKPAVPDPPRVDEAPRVRTPQTANDEQADRAVRATMGRAQGMLQNVNYQGLTPAARQQYDTARRFIALAD